MGTNNSEMKTAGACVCDVGRRVCENPRVEPHDVLGIRGSPYSWNARRAVNKALQSKHLLTGSGMRRERLSHLLVVRSADVPGTEAWASVRQHTRPPRCTQSTRNRASHETGNHLN